MCVKIHRRAYRVRATTLNLLIEVFWQQRSLSLLSVNLLRFLIPLKEFSSFHLREIVSAKTVCLDKFTN